MPDAEHNSPNGPEDLARRTTRFGIEVIDFIRSLPDDPTLWNAKTQLSRSSASVGANYREARRARSRAEFASRLQISLGEADESTHWLDIIVSVTDSDQARGEALRREAHEITAIFAAAAKKARRPLHP